MPPHYIGSTDRWTSIDLDVLNKAVMTTTRIGTTSDIPGMLALQEKYLYKNLNEAERKRGFVTTPFTAEQIEEIITQNGLFVATDENSEIVAYAFAGSWTYFEQWEIFNFMVSRFPQMSFQDKPITTEKSFQYGPICIDLRYRGSGLLNQLFEEMRIEFFKRYPISVTFINQVNEISEKAHTKKLGWEIVDAFRFNEKDYIALAFDMSRSVL